MVKKNRIKDAISHIIKFRVSKRLSLTKIKTRIIVFLGSTLLIINIVFTICPTSPAYAVSADGNEPKIIVCTRRDIPLENKFDSVAEKVGTKDVNVINQNILIDYITEHAEIFKNRVKAKTEKLQSKKQQKNQKKFNKKIHTLANLPKEW